MYICIYSIFSCVYCLKTGHVSTYVISWPSSKETAAAAAQNNCQQVVPTLLAIRIRICQNITWCFWSKKLCLLISLYLLALHYLFIYLFMYYSTSFVFNFRIQLYIPRQNNKKLSFFFQNANLNEKLHKIGNKYKTWKCFDCKMNISGCSGLRGTLPFLYPL